MQKVVTVLINVSKDKFIEKEHPGVNKYLEDGYSVKTITEVPLNSACYSLTFVLEKIEPSKPVFGEDKKTNNSY